MEIPNCEKNAKNIIFLLYVALIVIAGGCCCYYCWRLERDRKEGGICSGCYSSYVVSPGNKNKD